MYHRSLRNNCILRVTKRPSHPNPFRPEMAGGVAVVDGYHVFLEVFSMQGAFWCDVGMKESYFMQVHFSISSFRC